MTRLSPRELEALLDVLEPDNADEPIDVTINHCTPESFRSIRDGDDVDIETVRETEQDGPIDTVIIKRSSDFPAETLGNDSSVDDQDGDADGETDE